MPVLYVEGAARAIAWYERLGFRKEWEHQFEPGLPWFISVARGGVRLYLSEHKGDARPNTLIHLYVTDVDTVRRNSGSGSTKRASPGGSARSRIRTATGCELQLGALDDELTNRLTGQDALGELHGCEARGRQSTSRKTDEVGRHAGTAGVAANGCRRRMFAVPSDHLRGPACPDLLHAASVGRPRFAEAPRRQIRGCGRGRRGLPPRERPGVRGVRRSLPCRPSFRRSRLTKSRPRRVHGEGKGVPGTRAAALTEVEGTRPSPWPQVLRVAVGASPGARSCTPARGSRRGASNRGRPPE